MFKETTYYEMNLMGSQLFIKEIILCQELQDLPALGQDKDQKQ